MFEESKKTTEYIFVKMAIIFGLLYVFLIPPFQHADEGSHFKKAFLTHQLVLLPDVNQEGQVGNNIPNSLIDFENSNNKYITGKTNEKYSYNQFYLDFAASKDLSEKQFVSYSTSKTNPILYFPQAAFMTLTSLVFQIVTFSSKVLSPATFLYAGRIGNLIFFICCGFFSIKFIPFYKNLLLLLLLMPMSITLASSSSYDSMVISLTALFISIILYFAYNSKVTNIKKKEIIILSIFSIILIELKQVYYPIVGLFFLIPRNKFQSIRKYFSSFIIILSSGVFAHLLWMLISKNIIAAEGESSKYIQEQINFILHHPVDYLFVILRTFKELQFFYINSFVGNLGWLNTSFPFIYVVFYFVFLLVLAIIDTNQEVSIGKKEKAWITLLFIAIVILIETSMYLIWTSIPEIGGIGFPTVEGVQGRYFIPCILLFYLIFYSSYLHKVNIINKTRAFIIEYIPTFSLFSCIFTLFILILRFWVPGN